MKPAVARKQDEKENHDLRHELEREATASVLRAPINGGASAGIPAFLQRSLNDAAAPRTSDRKTSSPTSGADSRFVIGPRDDPLEQEAERVASAAASGGHAPLPMATRRQPSPASSKVGSGGERTPVRRAPRPDAAPAAAVEGSGAGPGEPLHSGVRHHAEAALGQPLDHVRVHTGPSAQQLAGALGARAFTHGSHIWVGKGESADDVRLMAHEATHVAQQGRRGGDGVDARRIQRMPATATNDGEVVHGKLNAELEKAKRDAEKNGGDKQKPESGKKPTIDPAERAAKKAELGPKAKPPRDRAGEARPKVERAAADTKAEAAKPPQKVKGQDKAIGEKGASKAPPGAAQAGAARNAYAAAAGIRAPVAPPPVITPKAVKPVDAGGRPLPADTASEVRVVLIAAAVQQMRMQATALRARAADERANAEIIRGNIRLAQSHIADSENSVTTVEGHVGYRRDVEGKAKSALDVSEQKAEKVASGAPGFVDKSSDGKEQSGPMASEAADLAGDAGNQKPDDEEAGGDAQEQAGQLSSTSGDLGSIDSAIGQTKTRAQGLEKDASLAKEKNTQSQKQIDTTDSTLAKTDAKLAQMKSQNAAARAKLGGFESGPARQAAGADALDQQALNLLDSSRVLEDRLHQAQQKHAAGMRAVPASKVRDRRNGAGVPAAAKGPPVLVQRVAAGAPEKVDLNLAGRVTDTVPTWLTGEDRQTEEQRQQNMQAEKKRREDEVAEIEKSANGDFSKLSATDKMGIALSLTGRHLWGGVAGTNWADFGGHLLRGFVDPRVSLMGIVSGLSMTISGFGTIYKQWDRDPLGAVLTGAAQIANGVTIVLGSITGLALAIMVILTAIAIIGSIFSFGAVGAALAPIIAFCGTVVSTVGGWTIVAAEVALVLNALVFIKDLIDAATAPTAENLQQNADAMTEDAKNEGNMALQIGMAKGAEFGAEVIGNTRFGQAMADQWGAVKQSAGLEAPPPAAPAADVTTTTGGSPPPAATAPGAPAAGATVAEPVTPPATDVAPPPAPTDAAPPPSSGNAPAAADASTPTASSTTAKPAAPETTEAPVKPADTAPPPSAKPGTAEAGTAEAGTAEPTTPPTSKPPGEPPQQPQPAAPQQQAPPSAATPKTAAAKPAVGEPAVTEPTTPAAKGPKPTPGGKGSGGSAAKSTGGGEPAVETPTQPLPEVKVENPAEGPGNETPAPKDPTAPSADKAASDAAKTTEATGEKPVDEGLKPADQGETPTGKGETPGDKGEAPTDKAEKPADKGEKPDDQPKPEEKPPAEATKEAMEKRAEELKQKREDLQKKAQELWEERNTPAGRKEPNRSLIDIDRARIGDAIEKIKLEERALDEDLHPEKYPKSSTAKGDIGEIKGHEKMDELGYKKIGSSKEPATGGEGKPQGLDGVYENRTPPPKYVVGEAKYGEADLRPEQRTKEWVDSRLDQALGKSLADKVRLEGYEYWKLHFDPATGVVTPTKILVEPPKPVAVP